MYDIIIMYPYKEYNHRYTLLDGLPEAIAEGKGASVLDVPLPRVRFRPDKKHTQSVNVNTALSNLSV